MGDVKVIQRDYRPHGHQENPFVEGGELSHKADYILRNSTISRTEVRISDPDNPPEEPVVQEVRISAVSASPNHSGAPNGRQGASGPEFVEVQLGEKPRDEPQKAEKVKLKKDKSKKKCCTVQ